MHALAGIAATPPSLRVDAVAEAVARQFGYRGELRPLVSERDQNFRLETASDGRFLVKVTSAAEAQSTTDFQVGVLRHLESRPDLRVPRVVATLRGDDCGLIEAAGTRHRLRMLSWVDGELLEAQDVDGPLATRFGQALGRLDLALAGHDFAGKNPKLLWDLQHAGELRPLLPCIDDANLRERVRAAIDDYERRVVPVMDELPQQVIHADANPENVVVDAGAIGFIDFGDIVRAPRAFDVGIAASYLRASGPDPLALVRPFLAGYRSIIALEPAEDAALFDLVRVRLATSITLLYWRVQDRPPGDEYRRKSLESESNASHFLAALDRLGYEDFLSEINYL